ncbi:cytochrome ubiquinol oxidase subunit I [Mesorhizobium sp. M7A.F.Ca.US.001.02.1.1]|uniref:cytochrome ubiquinol oxidase subunit I n=3 Tax=Mesorhizobium TaxID=68287 RepID=UPI0019D4D47A|nr:cytochrome ubiquinol oxidase subunit I [Mesorhizobium sp. M7A.F.Ca.US.001.02.1.1]
MRFSPARLHPEGRGLRSCIAIATAVRLSHRLAHPAAGYYCRMAAFIAMLEGLNFLTGRDIYLRISTFWIKIFSIAFGMGVVTGGDGPRRLEGADRGDHAEIETAEG